MFGSILQNILKHYKNSIDPNFKGFEVRGIESI